MGYMCSMLLHNHRNLSIMHMSHTCDGLKVKNGAVVGLTVQWCRGTNIQLSFTHSASHKHTQERPKLLHPYSPPPPTHKWDYLQSILVSGQLLHVDRELMHSLLCRLDLLLQWSCSVLLLQAPEGTATVGATEGWLISWKFLPPPFPPVPFPLPPSPSSSPPILQHIHNSQFLLL